MQFNEIIRLKFLFLSITWLSFFLSINLNPLEFENFNLINKMRIISPLFLTLSFIVYRIKIFKKNILNLDSLIFSIVFILYIIFNIGNSDNNLLNNFWPIYMMLTLFFIISLKDNFEKEFLLKFTIVILLVAFIFYFSLAIIDMIHHENYHFYAVWGSREGYGNILSPPRSSGLARIALILFTTFTLYCLTNKSKENYYLLLLISFFGICTLIFHSRTITFIYLIINIFFILFHFKIYISKKKIILFTLIIPLLINSAIIYRIHSYYLQDPAYAESKKNTQFEKTIGNLLIKSLIREQDDGNYSSGRFENWKLAYELIKINPLKGYGAQADRIYINQSVHSALIYSYLAGGLVAFIFIIIIYFRSLFFFIKFLYLKKLYTNYNVNFCISILVILNLRSILESSFAVFSIDYLIYIIAYFLLKNKLNLNIKN